MVPAVAEPQPQTDVPEPGAPVLLVGDVTAFSQTQDFDSLVNLEEDNNQWLQSNDEGAPVRVELRIFFQFLALLCVIISIIPEKIYLIPRFISKLSVWCGGFSASSLTRRLPASQKKQTQLFQRRALKTHSFSTFWTFSTYKISKYMQSLVEFVCFLSSSSPPCRNRRTLNPRFCSVYTPTILYAHFASKFTKPRTFLSQLTCETHVESTIEARIRRLMLLSSFLII